MKVIKTYKREWYVTVNKSTVMDLKFFKPDFGYEMYLDVLPVFKNILYQPTHVCTPFENTDWQILY